MTTPSGSGPRSVAAVADLMAEADAALCADGYTPFGDPNRAVQACLKSALDSANNDMGFVQPGPCLFTCTCVESPFPSAPCACNGPPG